MQGGGIPPSVERRERRGGVDEERSCGLAATYDSGQRRRVRSAAAHWLTVVAAGEGNGE